jgi:hypothetical protein
MHLMAQTCVSDFSLVLDSNMGMPEMQLLSEQVVFSVNVKGFSTFILFAEF